MSAQPLPSFDASSMLHMQHLVSHLYKSSKTDAQSMCLSVSTAISLVPKWLVPWINELHTAALIPTLALPT
jgi:hypothetical protein